MESVLGTVLSPVISTLFRLGVTLLDSTVGPCLNPTMESGAVLSFECLPASERSLRAAWQHLFIRKRIQINDNKVQGLRIYYCR